MQAKNSESLVRGEKYGHMAFCFLPLLLFALLAFGILGGSNWLLLPSVFLLVVVPLLDLLTGWQDNRHFEKNDFSPAETSVLRWNPRLYAMLYMGSVIYVAMSLERFTPTEKALLVVSSSLLGGIAFAAAHELLHGKEKIDQILQRI